MTMKQTIRNHCRTHFSGKTHQSLGDSLPKGRVKKHAAGFTYVGLLILLAIMGVVSTAALQVGVAAHRRVAEENLLNVGREFSRALDSYQRMTPSGQPNQPSTLQELLEDPRFPGVVRHLRKLYYDPVTGHQEWGIQRSQDSNRITGVFSLSQEHPIKTANFERRFQDFAGQATYQQWIFTAAQADTNTASPGQGSSIDPRALLNAVPGAAPPLPLPDGETDPRGLTH